MRHLSYHFNYLSVHAGYILTKAGGVGKPRLSVVYLHRWDIRHL